MIDEKTLIALLDSFVDPIVFVNTDHVIRYMNKVAIDKYSKKKNTDLVGKSIFDCHNERSKGIILEVFKLLEAGEDERLLTINSSGKKIFMRAVRDETGTLIGYYERYESV